MRILLATVNRTPVIILTLLTVFYVFPAHSLDLENIQVNSLINQKLEASIAIVDADEAQISQLEVTLAEENIFKRLGVERNKQLESLVFTVKQDDKQEYYIEVSSSDPISVEFLNFLLELNWPGGRLLREFTALLDQPIFLDDQPKQVSSPSTEQFLSQQREIQAEDHESHSNVLSVPKLESDQTPLLYGPVEKNESLWKIAEKIMPEGVTLEQIIYALYLENPEAFYRQNMNNLKEGSVLRLQSRKSITAISPDDALAIMAKHHNIWMQEKRERQNRRASTGEAIGLKNESNDASLSRARFNLDRDARLSLLVPDGERFSDTSTDNSRLNNAHQEHSLSSETLEAVKKENQVLQNRLQSIEGQVVSLRNLIQLKDEKLRLLQENKSRKFNNDISSLELDIASDNQKLTVSSISEKDKPSDSLWSDPLVLGTGVGVIALLGSLVLLLRRGNKTTLSRAPEVDELDSENNFVSKEQVFTDSDRSDISDVIIERQSPAKSTNNDDQKKMLIADEDNIEVPEGSDNYSGSSIDPISEADVYIAYGKYDKAAILLSEAIIERPENHQLKLKLLEVYSVSNNKELFIAAAEELYAALGGDIANVLWEQASIFAKNICPEHPLFDGVDSNASGGDVNPDAFDNISIPEFDVPEADAPKIVTQSETKIVVEEEAQESSQVAPEASSESLPEKMLTEEERAIKEDMQSLAASFSAAEAQKKSTLHDGISDVFSDLGYQSEFGSQDMDDASMFLLADEIGTKLDLARAYIEMGDKAGAKELLSEVEEEGNEQQQAEAKKLMEHTN